MTKKLNIKHPEILLLSFLGTGFFPKAPGTAGTLATIPILYFLGLHNITISIFLPILITLTVLICFLTDSVQKKYKVHDPSWIVIDESLGIATAWLFCLNSNLKDLAILFVLFRFFDIVKIWPASYFDKKVYHGAGTILDDIISGVYAGVCYKIILLFLK